MRFEDTPELFGGGCGTGSNGDLICEFCGKTYKDREDKDGNPYDSSESISITTFAGKQVCDCCFEEIENEILSRMDDIIPWFTRILKAQHKNLENYDNMLKELEKWSIGDKKDEN
jgi:hypothetical protein